MPSQTGGVCHGPFTLRRVSSSAAERPHFLYHLGLQPGRALDEGAEKALDIRDDLLSPAGVVLAGPLLTLADHAGGVAAALTAGKVLATSDLAWRRGPIAHPTRVSAFAVVLRAGRTTVVSEITLVDEHESPVAHAVMTSQMLSVDRPRGAYAAPDEPVTTPVAPLHEHCGITTSAGSNRTGTAEVVFRDDLRNGIGILHGGVIATVVEAAVLAASGDERAVLTDLDLRFLAPGRIGPVRAEATSPTANVWRTEVRDLGQAGRLITLATARTGIA